MVFSLQYVKLSINDYYYYLCLLPARHAVRRELRPLRFSIVPGRVQFLAVNWTGSGRGRVAPLAGRSRSRSVGEGGCVPLPVAAGLRGLMN